MKHARKDYERFQDPALHDRSLLKDSNSTPIAKDEPVMLFRAQDRYFVTVLQNYLKLLRHDQNINPEMIQVIQEHILLAKQWQKEHGCKIPDI